MTLLLLFLFVFITLAKFVLDWLNIQHRQQQHPPLPKAFSDHIDEERVKTSDAYALAGDKIGFIEEGISFVLALWFLFGGLLPWYDNWVTKTTNSFITQGLLFFGALLLVQLLIGMPFSLYRNFGLEEKFGFNKMNIKLWCLDTIKSLIIGTIFFAIIVGGALWLISAAPQSWWLWVWGFWAGMSLFMMYLSPTLIEPLFFKLTPIKKEGLEDSVRQLLKHAGIEAGKVQQVDASRRSGHSNAYFTGIGKVKRVVLFDTLLAQLENSELLAVLAHEIGHWKCHHIKKRLIKIQITALATCWVSFQVLNADWLPSLLGLQTLSFAGQVVVLFWLYSLLSFFWKPISSWQSRKDERQADQYAVDLIGDGQDLASGLVKLARENLSSLFPHPLYVALYYSHPDLITRVNWLENSHSEIKNHT
jgi:STE24 endopeptidase